jgi:hypothetical protein
MPNHTKKVEMKTREKRRQVFETRYNSGMYIPNHPKYKRMEMKTREKKKTGKPCSCIYAMDLRD